MICFRTVKVTILNTDNHIPVSTTELISAGHKVTCWIFSYLDYSELIRYIVIFYASILRGVI